MEKEEGEAISVLPLPEGQSHPLLQICLNLVFDICSGMLICSRNADICLQLWFSAGRADDHRAGGGIGSVVELQTFLEHSGRTFRHITSASIAEFPFQKDIALWCQSGNHGSILYSDCIEILDDCSIRKLNFVPVHGDKIGIQEVFCFDRFPAHVFLFSLILCRNLQIDGLQRNINSSHSGSVHGHAVSA